MRRKLVWTAGLAAATACALGAGMCSSAYAADYATYDIAASNGATSASLDPNSTTNSYDIDGDGVKDTVECSLHKQVDDPEFYSRMTLEINDASVVVAKGTYFFMPYVNYVKLKDGTGLIYVLARAESDYVAISKVYRYADGKITQVLNCTKAGLGSGKYGSGDGMLLSKVNGNKLVVDCWTQFHACGYTSYSFTYKHDKAKGTFARTSYLASAKAMFTKPMVGKHVTWSPIYKSVKLYKGTGLSKVATTLKKGTKAKVTAVYINGKTVTVKVKAKSGQQGWLKLSKKQKWDEKTGRFTNQIFKYALFAS